MKKKTQYVLLKDKYNKVAMKRGIIMKCPHCKRVVPTTRFCLNCGTQLQALSARAPI